MKLKLAQGDQPVLQRIEAHRRSRFSAGLLIRKLIHGAVQENHEHDTAAAPQNYSSERGLDWPLTGEPLKSLLG